MPKIILIIVCLLLSGLLVAKEETASDEHSAAINLSEQLYENLKTSNPLNIKVRKLALEGSQFSSEFQATGA